MILPPLDLEWLFPLDAKPMRVVSRDDRDLLEILYSRQLSPPEVAAALRRRGLRRRDDERIGLIRRLLPVMDAVDRLLEGIDENAVASDTMTVNYIRAIIALRKRLRMLLEREGVTPIEEVGVPVDLDRHEVVELVESTDYVRPTVVGIRERGYALGDRILRDAKVVAARPRASVGVTADGRQDGKHNDRSGEW